MLASFVWNCRNRIRACPGHVAASVKLGARCQLAHMCVRALSFVARALAACCKRQPTRRCHEASRKALLIEVCCWPELGTWKSLCFDLFCCRPSVYTHIIYIYIYMYMFFYIYTYMCFFHITTQMLPFPPFRCYSDSVRAHAASWIQKQVWLYLYTSNVPRHARVPEGLFNL